MQTGWLGEDPHDRLHPHSDDPAWFEAFWFGFCVPSIDLTVYVYRWFRTALGLWGGGVLAWDARGHLPWTMLHQDYRWSEPLGEPGQINRGDAILTPQGVTIAIVSPGRDYRVRYDHPALAFEILYEAVGVANIATHPVGGSTLFSGHLDQPGRVTGWVRIGEQTHPVDCYWVRDRSWGPRRNDNAGMHIGYYHATASARDAFLLVTDARAEPAPATLITGYLIRDGVSSPLVSGTARLTRTDDLSPATCTIEATDALDRTLAAHGTSRTRLAYQIQPGMFNWSTLARWRFNGVEADGELQDTWHPDTYRSFARKGADA